VFILEQTARGAIHGQIEKATTLANSTEYAKLLTDDGSAAREFKSLIFVDPIAVMTQEHSKSFVEVALPLCNRILLAMAAMGTICFLCTWLLSRPMESLLRWKLKRRYRVDNVPIG
jgi:hypothetical protein